MNKQIRSFSSFCSASRLKTKRRGVGKIRKAAVAFICLLAGISVALSAKISVAASRGAGFAVQEKLYLPVRLNSKLKASKLKPGDIVEGTLSRDVYSGRLKVFPAGSRIKLTVSGLERRRKERSSYWPWIVKVFMPRREAYPVFNAASVALPDGTEIPLHVSVISTGNQVRVIPASHKVPLHANSAKHRRSTPGNYASKRKRPNPCPAMLLQAESLTKGEMAKVTTGESDNSTTLAGPVTLAAGTTARVILLSSLSASKSRDGERFRALLLEPVRIHSTTVLPEGTIFQGKVETRKPPRWLSRPGSLRITFTRLTLPAGASNGIEASLSEAELDKSARLRMDSEGDLRGGRPGAAWMLINLGASAGIAKVSDDTLQLIIEAAVSTATDASTAGVARLVAGAASGIFLVTRHGRDVILPKYTEMGITFNRPLLLSRLPKGSDSGASPADTQGAGMAGQ